MTKELRERLQIWKEKNRDRVQACQTEDEADDIVLEMIEQEIVEAERRGREEMRKECLATIPPFNEWEYTNDYVLMGRHEAYQEIRAAISSLK